MSTPAKRKAAVIKAAAIAPKKYEVEEIAALMESDEFDNATQAARKVIATAFALMTERTWYAIASRLDGGPGGAVSFYGFFATEGAALKALEKNSLALFGKASVVEITGLTVREDQIQAHEDKLTKDCAQCGHTEPGHDWPRSRRGCVILGCTCKNYTRPMPDMEPVEAI